MRSLASISILILLLAGCASVKPVHLTPDPSPVTRHPSPVTRYLPPSASHLFKASLDIKDHHLTGLLVIKQMATDSTETKTTPEDTDQDRLFRIVFVNEVGMTFFDLELAHGSMKVISCFASLNRKALHRILETDFSILLFSDTLKNAGTYRQESTGNRIRTAKAGKIRIWQTYSPEGDTLLATAAKSNMADPVTILYGRYSEGVPLDIAIENPVIKLTLRLRKLSGS